VTLNGITIDDCGMTRLQLGPDAVLSSDFAQVILVHDRHPETTMAQMLRPPGTAIATRGFVYSYFFPELLCHRFARMQAEG
jgi:hypothetical protein